MSFISDIFGGQSKELANQAQKSEREKQNLIDQGMAAINAIFEGGSYPIYTKATEYDRNATYYRSTPGKKDRPYVEYVPSKPKENKFKSIKKTINKAVYNLIDPTPKVYDLIAELNKPEINSDGKFISNELSHLKGEVKENFDLRGIMGAMVDKTRAPAPYEKLIEKGKLYTMADSPTYTGYGDAFYDQRAQDYIDYAMPQLKQQFLEAYNKANFSLADRGLINSSIASMSQTGMRRQLGQEEQTVYNTGITQAEQTKQQIEAAKQSAINMLYTTSDPASAISTALSSAASANWPNLGASFASTFMPSSGSSISSAATSNANNNDWSKLLSQLSQNSSVNSGAIPK